MSNKSQGLSSQDVVHSFCGTQKSIAGIKSCTLRSILTIENRPIETNTRFFSPLNTSLSSNTLQIHSGIVVKSMSSVQQQILSSKSTTLADRHSGSTTSSARAVRQSCRSCSGTQIFLPRPPNRTKLLFCQRWPGLQPLWVFQRLRIHQE